MARIKLITTHYTLIAILAVLLMSCDLFPDIDQNDPYKNIDNLGENEFYAQNITNGRFYKIDAQRLYEGTKCVIWAETGSGVTLEQAQGIAREYDTIIRPRVVGAFSMKNVQTENGKSFADMLEYANYLAGRDDRKLTILLLDIKDGFNDPAKDPYVAGYFFGADFQPKGKISGTGQYSNGRDMIYIDTYPGLKLMPKSTYATFAHELQHLINYVTSRGLRNGPMDTWIDEGLSSQAEYLYYGENPKDKVDDFIKDRAGTIAKGNNFFVWGNDTGNSFSILDEYATVYLFFRWLYLQADEDLQKSIFLEIVTSDSRNYQAVTDVAKKINPGWSDWEPLLRTWLAANCYPKNTYGYKGDIDLQNTIKVKPITVSTVSLYPGEGVYSVINSSFEKNSSGNIGYAGLSASTETIGTSSPYTGSVLLTFNANTNNRSGPRETGSLTGVSPAVSPSRMAGESDQSKKRIGPYVVDARDLLGRDSW
jgi:hypothetical protein